MSARLVNEFVKQSYDILSKHKLNEKRHKNYLLPANIIVPRDAGIVLPILPKLKGWQAVVSMPLEVGITKLAGMNVVRFDYPEAKGIDVYGNLYEGLKKTINESIKTIKENKFDKYFIHFKETDIPGHDNKPKEKVKMIELIDKTFFKFLKEDVENLELVVTGDHASPCELHGHAADPVPLIHFGKDKHDDIKRFTEYECIEGYYGKLMGKDVLKKVEFL